MPRRCFVLIGVVLAALTAACIQLPFDVQDGCVGPILWRDSVWVFPDTLVVAADSGLVKVCWTQP